MEITLYYKGEGDGVSFMPLYPMMFKRAFQDIGINAQIVKDSCYDYLGVPADNFFREEYQNLLGVLNKLAPEPKSFKDFYLDFNEAPPAHIYGTTTSAGCKYHCKFCPNSEMDYITRDKDRVIEEVKWLCDNTMYFEFFDNNVLQNDDFLDIIEVIPPFKKWGALINIEPPNGNLIMKLMKMHDHGCRNIYLGLETFNELDLAYFGKPFLNKVDPRDFMEMLQDLGFNVFVFVIRGLPNETEYSFKDMTDYLDDHNILYGISRFFEYGKEVKETANLSKEYLADREKEDILKTEENLKKFLNIV